MLEEHSICKLFRTTKYYLYFNLLQLLLSLMLLTTLLFSDTLSVIPLEFTIGLLLLIDVSIRFFSDKLFLQRLYNKVDLILLVVVVGMLALEFYGGAAYEPLEEVGNLALTIRFGIQLFRIYNLFKQYKEMRIIQKMGDITLPNLDLTEEFQGNHSYIQGKIVK